MAGHEYSMNGVKVSFPAKAYPSQVAMMSKIITSLQRSQNALLESPTGSGKTLALLCAALAWQEQEQRKIDEWNSLVEKATVNQDEASRDVLMAMAGDDDFEDENETVGTLNPSFIKESGGFLPPAEDDDDDFVNPELKKLKRQSASSMNYHLPPVYNNPGPTGTEPNYLKMPKKRKCPKIYFGTRTHKQVAQIVRELKKTKYAGVRMTILASRDHTCVHPTISKSFNKTQDCQDLMDKRKGGGCRFQANVKAKMATHQSVRAYIGTDSAWDIEELVKAGKKVKACPYYAVRELKTSAQLVICPYNYLVEPNIRGSMEISLKNQIVILDEAHNIEDSARDAASGSFKIDDVEMAMKDCEKMVEYHILPQVHESLAEFLSRLCNWMQKCSNEAGDYNDFNSSTKVFTGTNGLAEWNEMVFSPLNYYDVKSLLQEAIKEQNAAMEENNEGFNEGPAKVISKKTTDLLGGIFTVLDFMHRKDSCYRDDYKISIVKANERPAKGKVKSNTWVGKGDAPAFVTTITLNFWCLNPGVCFDELLDCRSIVLTSGTLSPMLTFASELEVKFPVSLEANHVIDKSQVWVGTLSSGPTGHSLNAAYQNSNTYGFQDEIGKLLLNICSTVPHGVLVFLPSYKLLNDLTQRWQATGMWTQIFDKKAILSEPRFGDQLENVMKEFYGVIQETNVGVNEFGQNGAIFLAVCRGKVSEGLDFADNNARAVICVGIPFPAVKDTLVDLKKKYNDSKRATKPHLLPGRDWYEIQAFRALNQALGRCIRHKQDWGAILMVDDRYSKNPRYVNSLSKWVRGRVVHFSNCNIMLDSIKTFTGDMKHLEVELAQADKIKAMENVDEEDDKSKVKVNIKDGNQDYWYPNTKYYKNTNKVKDEKLSPKASVKTAWSPVALKTKPIVSDGKPLNSLNPVSLTNLDFKTNLNSMLDCKTNLNGLGNVDLKKESQSFDSQYGTLEEVSTNKRKHSSTASECNFDIDDDDIVFQSEETKTAKSKNSTTTSAKQKLQKFRREEKPKPLADHVKDNLPNLNNLINNDNIVNERSENESSVLRYSSDQLEKENSDERSLKNLLKSRRTQDHKEVKAIPDTPEKFDEDDDFMNNLDFSDLDAKSSCTTSSKKPLFSSFVQKETSLSNVRSFPAMENKNPVKSNPTLGPKESRINPVRSFPAVEMKMQESPNMFESDDDEMFLFEEKHQVKPSLSSADEIEEPEEEFERKIKVPKKKSLFKKNRTSLPKSKPSKLLPTGDSDDDFK